MKILLVNPNRFKTPPVIPLALEHLCGALRSAGHEVEILDLCFAAEMKSAADAFLKGRSFDLIGLTVRNIDSALYINNVFLLPEIRELARHLKTAYRIPMVLGGSGFSGLPEEILDYMGADYGVIGPGEGALPHLAGGLAAGRRPSRLLDGWSFKGDPQAVFPRGRDIDYKPYLANDGLAGIETQKGCTERCAYCLEAGRPMVFRKPESVVAEIKAAFERGATRFHTCDSEFNQNPEHCAKVLSALKKAALPLKLYVYLKPKPMDENLCRRLAEAGTVSATLSVDSREIALSQGRYTGKEVEATLSMLKTCGIKTAVDLLTGFPGETKEETLRTFDALRRGEPNTVGVNFTFRLLPYTAMGKAWQAGELRDGRILGGDASLPPGLAPIFYQRFSLSEVEQLIDGDPLFAIEGLQKTSNYQRLEGK